MFLLDGKLQQYKGLSEQEVISFHYHLMSRISLNRLLNQRCVAPVELVGSADRIPTFLLARG